MNPALLIPLIFGGGMAAANKLRNIGAEKSLEKREKARHERTQEQLAQAQTGVVPPAVLQRLYGQPQATGAGAAEGGVEKEVEQTAPTYPIRQTETPVGPSADIGKQAKPMTLGEVHFGKDGSISYSLKPDRDVVDAKFLGSYAEALKKLKDDKLAPAEAQKQAFFSVVEKMKAIPSPSVVEQLMPDWEDVYKQQFHRLTSAMINDENFRRIIRLATGLDPNGRAFANALQIAAMRVVGDEMNYMPEDIRKSVAEAEVPKLTPEVEQELAANGIISRFATPDQIQAAISNINLRKTQQVSAETKARGFATEHVAAETFEPRLSREEIETYVETLSRENAEFKARLGQPISPQLAEDLQIPVGTTLEKALATDFIPVPEDVKDTRKKVRGAQSTLNLLRKHFERAHNDTLSAGDRIESALVYRRLRKGFLSILARNVGDEKGNLAQSDYKLAEKLTAGLTASFLPGMYNVYLTQFDEIDSLLESKIAEAEAAVKPIKAGGKKTKEITVTVDKDGNYKVK